MADPARLEIRAPQPLAITAVEVDNAAGLTALAARVTALEAVGIRRVSATLSTASVAVTLAAGEVVAAVSPQAATGIIWQGVAISGTTHTLHFSGAPASALALVLTIVKAP